MRITIKVLFRLGRGETRWEMLRSCGSSSADRGDSRREEAQVGRVLRASWEQRG